MARRLVAFDPPPYRVLRGPLRNGHVQTLAASLLRRVHGVAYTRTRIDTPDGDFLDVDWAAATSPPEGPPRAAVVSHGLEGNSHRAYVRGMARALGREGWDVAAWNMRGCSGEPNRLLRAYHSGATEDLAAVLAHVFARGYETVALVGFSLGGNMTLRYLGESGADADPRLLAAAAFSVPTDLSSSGVVLARPSRRLYMEYFLRSLRGKVAEKAGRFEGAPDAAAVRAMRSFADFDGHFTAPVHGFESAADYYARASAGPLLPRIAVPTLLVQAADDPFLSPPCYPVHAAAGNPHLHLVVPRYGGHVGFIAPGETYYSEALAQRFFAAALRAQRASRVTVTRASASSASRSAAPSSTA